MLPVLKTQNKLRKNKDLYLQSDYNISAYFTNPENPLKPTITRILNALIKALNDTDHLPKYILVICDKDILETMDTSRYNPKKLIKSELFWLHREITRTLQARRENLRNIKPGSISAEPTRVIWVKMLARPLSTIDELIRVLKLRRKFNDIIDDLARDDTLMHVMSLSTLNEFIHFTNFGDLSAHGQTDFWIEVNDQIKLFDYHQIELKPFQALKQSQTPDASKKNDNNNNPLVFGPVVVKKEKTSSDNDSDPEEKPKDDKQKTKTPTPKKRAHNYDRNDHSRRRFSDDRFYRNRDRHQHQENRRKLPSPPPRYRRDNHRPY